ncbi:MAG: hypothetical protein M1832_005346 [Thelocarpon impressellum]|nr:MAG: hypothetical protein M1832_005346 [Thelocarpon impressellum]
MQQLKLSPLTMLLKLLVNPSPGLPAPSIKTLVWSIIQQSQLLQIATGSAALDALIASLKNTRKAKVTKQWPFAVKSTAISEEGKTSLTSWLARFMGYLRQVGESDGMLSKLAEICCGTPGMEVYAGVWKKSLRRRRKGGFEPSAEALSDLPNTDQPTLEDTVPMELANADDYLVDATVESVDASALFRWVKKDIQDVIEDGDAGGLIMCLCADEIGLRRQALSGIAKLVAKLQHSTYVEQEMVALLLQELAATARTLIDAAPLSTYLAVFASRAVLVQANPQHCLYGKINHFLHQGPRWDAEKLPLMHKILLHPPDNDDAHYEELGWLLDTTVQGLRTARDMDIYRRSNVFERFLSLYITPHLPHKLKMKIASLLVRAANTEGGSTTLITRAGVLSWIEVPEDIILGPPKTAFASAIFRTASKSLESSEIPPLPHDPDLPRNPRYTSREKLSKDRDGLERDMEPAWESRSRALSGKRTGKDDGDGWTSVKPRKSFGHEDGERFPRRNLDRGREKGLDVVKESKERGLRTFEGYGRDKDGEGDKEALPRRNGVPRGRNEASWFREKESQPPKEKEIREATRDREWRDKDRAADRAWPRGGRAEKDPEWMDNPAAEEQKQVHTAEDFQRWKERMKAGGTPAEEKPKVEINHPVETNKPEPAALKTDHCSEAPIVVDAGIDKFLGMWNEPKSLAGNPGPDPSPAIPKKDTGKVGAGRASRFTSFFSPQEELSRQEAVPEMPPRHPHPTGLLRDSSNEDKEGFQRILQMLGGSSIDAEKPKPQADHHQRPQPSTAENSRPDPSSNASGFNHDAITAKTGGRQPDGHEPRTHAPANLESLMGPQMSDSGATHNRDKEFFLGLMHNARPTYGEDNLANASIGPQLFHQTQGVHPDWMRGQPREGAEIKSVPGPPPGFSSANPAAAFQRRQHENPPVPQVVPGSIPRPPGFEQAPPNWPSNALPPAQARPVPPPPGLGNDITRGLPFQPFGPPPPGMPFPPAQFRSGLGPGGVAMPPNMPPPGFFSMNAPPPPGYPPMPFQPDAMLGMPVGRPGAPPFDPFAEVANAARGRGAPPGL